MALQFPEVDDDLVEKIVDKLKSQGIFDQFRKDCLADVDSRPAYQNLRDKVNRAVANFLSRQPWRDDLNKNQVRECLRKHVHQGYLEAGVNRIVEQVVKPKIFSVFTPKVEDVVYEVMGIERPTNTEDRSHNRLRYLMSSKPHEKNLAELLPNDLDPVSPGSINESGNESANLNDSFTSKTLDDGDNVSRDVNREFNTDANEASNDSKVSGISELSSHGSTTKLDISESAHLPGDKSEIRNSNNCVISNDIVDKDKSKGAIDSTPGSFDFDNFSNLKEKLMKTDPLNKNIDKITCVVKNSESETNDDSEKNLEDLKRLKEDSHNLISTEDKNVVKSPVPFIYSEDSIGSNSHRLRIENESTRNSLVIDCDDTSSMFLDKKSIVKEIESVSCIESLKEESQISIASNDSRKFSNFSNLKSVNDNSRGRSEGSSPDLKDNKKKESDKEKKSSTGKSDQLDKYDSKYKVSRDSSRDRKYSKDDKKYHDDKDKSKHDKDRHSESSKKESSSRDKYSSRSRDDKYRNTSRHSDKKSDDSKRDSRSSNYYDKSKRDKDSKPSHNDKLGKKDESKTNSDIKSSSSKDNRYSDRKSSKRDDSKRSSDDYKSSRSKEDNRSSGSKDKSSKTYSDDDKYSKRDSKGSKSIDNKDSKASDRKNSSRTKDDSRRDKDMKSGSEHDESKNSKKDKSSETRDNDKVSSGSIDKSKGDTKYCADKERKKNSNSNETNSKKDDKDSKKRKRENCSEDTIKKENRRSRDRDDGGHKDSGNSSTRDQKNESDKKRGSNKQDKISSSSSKGSKEPSDSHTDESDRKVDNAECPEINNSCGLYSSENSVYKKPKISNESDSDCQLNNLMVNIREGNVFINGIDDSLRQSTNSVIIENLDKISNLDDSGCKQESVPIAESSDICLKIKKIPSLLPQVSEGASPNGIWDDITSKNDDNSKKNVYLHENFINSKISSVPNENYIVDQQVEQILENGYVGNSEHFDFHGFDDVSLGNAFKAVFSFEQFMKLTYGSNSLGVKCSEKCFLLTDNNLNNIKVHDYPSLLKEFSIAETDLRNSLIYANSSFESSFSSGGLSPHNKSVNCLNKYTDEINNSSTLQSTVHCDIVSNSEEKFKGSEAIVKHQENTVLSHLNEMNQKLENEDMVSPNESSSSDRCFTLPSVTEDMLDIFMMKNIGNEDNCYNSSDSEEDVTSSPSGVHCSSKSPQNHGDKTHEGSAILCSNEIPSDKHLKSEMQKCHNQEDISFSEKDGAVQGDKKIPPRTSQRYNSSDLYKPRPLITNSSRRNRVTDKKDLAQGTKRSAEAMEFSENKRPR